MSFGSSFNVGALDVGTLSATFNLNSSAATASIASIINQTNSLKQSFTTNNILKVDSTAAVSSINKASSALDTFKKGLELVGAYKAFDLLTKGIGDLGHAIIGINASLEQSQLRFTALTGSVQTASTLMGQLETLAAHSTFGLPQITAAAGSLLAFNVAAANVPALINAIQNASAAAGGDMEANFSNIARILGELAGGLPLTERQIRQLVTAGVPLQQLAQQLGITVDQLLNVGKTGIVTGPQLVAAFAEVYNNGKLGDFMQKQAGTFSGAMALIKTNLSLATAQAFQPLFQVVSNLAVKFGEFIQTPTFNQWVVEIRRGVEAVISVFESLGNILAPVGKAMAAMFGLNTANIGTEMEAAKNARPNITPYDPSLQGGGPNADQQAVADQARVDALTNARQAAEALDATLALPTGQRGVAAIIASLGTLETTAQGEADHAVTALNTALSATGGITGPKDAKQYLEQFTVAGNAATQVVRGLNAELAANKQALDDNAAAIQTVKDQYDPIIKGAQESIAAINLKSAAEITRTKNELALDLKKAALELAKPDVSQYDAKILSDQTTLDNMPRLDTSQWDTNISGAQSQIQALQDAISGLNTDEFDRKINAIQDKLAEPPPDTHGITNQLTALQGQLASGQITKATFDTQYGSLAGQKTAIDTKYQDDTSGLKGQLKLLERERADQRLANQETARADKGRIDTLTDYANAQTKERAAAEKEDARKRQALSDDIKLQENDRTNALAGYTAAMAKISDAQAHNAALDAAAAAQRKLDLFPYQQTLDAATAKEKALLDPLDQTKIKLDEANKTISEQKTYWDQVKSGITDAKGALDAYVKTAGGGTSGGGNGTLDNRFSKALGSGSPLDPAQQHLLDVNTNFPTADSPFLTQMKNLKAWLDENIVSIQDKIKLEAKLDLSAVMQGVDFIKAVSQTLSDIYNGNWGNLRNDLVALKNSITGGNAGASLVDAGQQGGGPNGNGQEITGGPDLSGQMPQIASPYGYPGYVRINPNGPTTYAPQAPGTKPTEPYPGNYLIQQVNDQVDKWLNSHGLGFLTSFGKSGEAIQGLVNPSVSAASGDPVASQKAIDDYVQHIKDQLGDNGTAQQAVQSFLDQISGEQGTKGIDQAIKDAEKTFTDTYGDGGTVPAALTQTGDITQKVLGTSGTVPNILQLLRTNDVPLTVAGLLAAFGQGGATDQSFSHIATTAGTTLGPGGTVDGHLSSFDAKVGTTMGDGGTAQGNLAAFDAKTQGIFGTKGTGIAALDAFVAGVTGVFKPGGSIAVALSGFGGVMDAGFAPAIASINAFMGNLATAIQKVGAWFGDTTLSGITWTPLGGGNTALKNALDSAVHHADGLGGGMPGHWAMIGERGPEAMYVPAGATIVPNHLLPGHADGLIGADAGALPGLTLGGALAGVGTDLSGRATRDLAALIARLTGAQHAGAAGGSGSALEIVRAVKAATSDPDLWLAMLMAVASEQRTLTGPFVDQIGGGPGRGPFQIEAGPGGSNAGMISEADARDPYKAAQYMVGRFIAAKRGPWGTDNEIAGAETAAAAEVGAAFLAGNPLGYPQSVVDAAYRMATDALQAQAAAGPFTNVAGGWPAVIQAAMGMENDPTVNGPQWNLLCEKFAEMAERAAGFSEGYWATAADHGYGVAHNSGWGPPGSMQHWGSGYYPLGHAALNVDGNGLVVGTSPTGIAQYSMSGAQDNLGWVPPGMAAGGAFSVPTTVTVGDGGEREWVLPEHKLDSAIRRAGGGTTITVAPGAVVIQVQPGEDPYAAGQRGGAGFLDALRGKGFIVR